ncbi:MAG: ATP synthase F1 subunit delta [Heliobacteriaceae bacterium]|jgi:F-type H+-transporting ATPase subunit delta|nr:ATP synthase F1 subunit delta [Heliobacteriaceae bacterium]
MRISTSDKNYANALIQIEEAEANIKIIEEILSKSPDLSDILVNPSISQDIKYSIITEIFSKDVSAKIVEFLKILVNKKRFGEFNTIAAAFYKKLDEINDIKRVEVVSAVDLNNDTRKRITERLQTKLQKTIIPQWSINEEIIAGLVIKIEDDIIDASLKNKIESLGKGISK